jgi:hypothetical protein
MSLIAPLLRQQPGEVLINFMTDYVRRFIDHPQQQTREQFAALFGSSNIRDKVLALTDPHAREEALLRSYAEEIKRTGRFRYACTAIILYPEIDRSFFHLIYATRDRKGVEVFKDVEQRAMEIQEQTSAAAKQRKRLKKTHQPEMFASTVMPHSRPIDELRQHYLRHARPTVLGLLQSEKRVPYEDAWDTALSFPLVWDCDLKDWVQEWSAEELLTVDGMTKGQRVPRLGKNNFLVWQEQSGGRP